MYPLRRFVLWRVWFLACIMVLSTTVAAQHEATLDQPELAIDVATETYQLGSVQIYRRNIFDDANRTIAARAINGLHTVTRERVIRGELWFQPGDQISASDATELDRLFRDLDLFAEVSVLLQPDPSQPGTAALLINTEDRLSIIASAGGSFLGGVGEVGFSVGDKNLLGLGHLLEFGYSTSTDGSLRGSVAYNNVLGNSVEVLLGIEQIASENSDSTNAVLFFSGWSHNAPGPHTYLNVGLDSFARSGGNTLDDWSVSAGVTAYYTGLRTGTLATRLHYRSAASTTGLDPQQSLGESNGLRGYSANEFNGEQRLLFNLEHRFSTAFRVSTFEVAGLLFLYSGWVGERGNRHWLDEPHPSVGGGLRIGSRPLLGSGVIRLDVAYPLDDDPTQDYGPTVSFALAQTFDFTP